MTKEKAMEVIEDFDMAKAQKTEVKQCNVDKLKKMLDEGKFTGIEAKVIRAGEQLRYVGKSITPYAVGQLIDMPGHKVRLTMLNIGKKLETER